MLTGLLIAIHILVCLGLIGVILLQRSEGGALGMGGGPSGFMTARGAGNLLTRTTAILGGAFFVLSLTLTLVGGGRTTNSVTDRVNIENLDPSRLGSPAPTAPATTGLPQGPLPGAPATGLPGPIEAPRPTLAPTPTAPAADATPPAAPTQP